MRWQERSNSVLKRLTGYQILSARSVQALRRDATKNNRREARTRRELDALTSKLDAQVKRIEVLTAPKPKPAPKLPGDYDDVIRAIWPLVKDRTMTGHEKVNFLTEAVRYLERHDIPGGLMECGVWRGGSMLAIAHTLSRIGMTDRHLYLFDTFEGMTPPTDRDVHIWEKKDASELLASQSTSMAPIWAAATLEDVRQGFAEVDYPDELIHYIVGKVEDTVPESAPEQIALLRLDTDWYESTKHELNHLYSRLAPGGVLVIDDYGSWQGSKDATDEFLAETGEPLMLTRVGRGRVGIKPGLATRV